MSSVGLARFWTLRSWLSQWSYDDANADAVKAGPDIVVPICTDWLHRPGFSL